MNSKKTKRRGRGGGGLPNISALFPGEIRVSLFYAYGVFSPAALTGG